MARTQIPVKAMDRRTFVLDQAESPADPTNGMFVINDGATWLEVRNTNAAARTFTVVEPGVVDQDLPIGDRTYTVPGTGTTPAGRTGAFPRSLYGETLLIDIPVGQTDLRFTAYSLLTS